MMHPITRTLLRGHAREKWGGRVIIMINEVFIFRELKYTYL